MGPESLVTDCITAARAPDVPAFNMAIAGMIVTKIPANSFATSKIGNQLNSFASLIFEDVYFQLMYVRDNNKISLIIFCNSTWT